MRLTVCCDNSYNVGSVSWEIGTFCLYCRACLKEIDVTFTTCRLLFWRIKSTRRVMIVLTPGQMDSTNSRDKDGWVFGQKDRQGDRQMAQQIGQTDSQMDRQAVTQTHSQTDGWTDGWRDVHTTYPHTVLTYTHTFGVFPKGMGGTVPSFAGVCT